MVLVSLALRMSSVQRLHRTLHQLLGEYHHGHRDGLGSNPSNSFCSGDGFVIHSSQNSVEDPFKSSTKDDDSAQKNSRGFMNTTPSTRHGEALASTNWRSGSSSGNSSESPTARKSTNKDISMKTCASKDPGINSDRVSNRNAQAIYPPSACVFVAK